MKSLNRAASILLGCFVLTGCSSLHKEVQSGVILDQVSYEARSVHYHQVLDDMGPPARLTASPGGFAFIYEDLIIDELQLGIGGRNNFWEWLKLSMAGTTLERRSLLLQFDPDGALKSAGLLESEEDLGKGGAMQLILQVKQIVDTSEYEDDAIDAARWGVKLLEPLPIALNTPQNLNTGASGLEQSGTTTKVGQHTLEMQ
jgi:hypothetical protein